MNLHVQLATMRQAVLKARQYGVEKGTMRRGGRGQHSGMSCGHAAPFVREDIGDFDKAIEETKCVVVWTAFGYAAVWVMRCCARRPLRLGCGPFCSLIEDKATCYVFANGRMDVPSRNLENHEPSLPVIAFGTESCK